MSNGQRVREFERALEPESKKTIGERTDASGHVLQLEKSANSASERVIFSKRRVAQGASKCELFEFTKIIPKIAKS